jgi:uncharacterized membrane protein YedE/YeeE
VHPDFSPVSAALGGALIGVSASLLLLAEGRIAGVSGILGGLLSPQPGDVAWRLSFVIGLVTAGAISVIATPELFAADSGRSPALIALAGLLVGFGTRLGNGCTSGHGVCGVARGSRRSAAAVATFMTSGALTVWWTGGASP